MPTDYVHQLDNGLVLLGEPSDAFQSAAFSLLISAGCRHDPAGQAGLASLSCEMMLRGAGDRDSRHLISDLENLGVERSESVGVSQANFSGATISASLIPALSIYADIVRRPHLPEDQLEAGRAVCIQELRGVEDDPGQKLMMELRRRHYPDPWGRPSHGEQDDLAKLTAADVQQFFTNRYGPRDAILGIAGNFDWQEVCNAADELFGDWKVQADYSPITEMAPSKDTHLTYDSNQSHIGLAFPSIPYRHPQYFEAWSAVGVLSGGMSSRLFSEVREKRGLCYTVYASLHTQRERAAVFCYAGTTAERAQETLDVTHSELVRLGEGVQAEELARLKARIKSSLIMQQESTSARAGSLSRDWYHLGRIRPIEEVAAKVDALTAESINAYLAANPPETFTCLTLGPQPLELPNGIS
ncbi:insulinase family protein [Aeoliella sp. ICT_H6.2]|uniref:Insulinase family protein n=1 Tax=Aeoliella straminimaris TaxID=2954799 RepID=A0A9X2JKH8_9BACT|nr:insulinase family protein [Aeoliella straminimaris]